MIEIRCNGNFVRGFTSVNVTKSLDQIAASYSLGVFRDDSDSAWIPIFPGDAVEIAIDDEVVISGFNVETSPSFNNSGIVCKVSGKEKTCDLVDCASKTINFENKKVDEIVRIVCADFGLNFTGSNGAEIGSPLKKFSAEIGTTAMNVIVNACKERNLYPTSDGLGNVSIIGGKYGSAEVDIVQGMNVLSASGKFSVANRFNKYTVYSSADPKCNTSACVKDDGISRDREFVLLDERFSTMENCESRALWEAKHRNATGNSFSVVVDGWRQTKGGSLWKPGIMVNCDIPMILGESRAYLVNRVVFGYGSEGTQTTIELVDEDIYLPTPTIAPKAKLNKKHNDTWASIRKQTGSKLK